MHDPLSALEPRLLWDHFASLAGIPRPSKREERVVAWIRELAATHRFEVRSDEVGNLVVEVPATPGLEAAPVIVLQGHLDMVCEKNEGVDHDFDRDPIRARVDGEWVRAEGTTLGADNGIGVAAMLAAATDPETAHGPLELLFTLDEETGLTGAQRLDPSLLRGRTLLNLDSEDDGVLFVGCAGGADCLLEFPFRPTAPSTAHHAVDLAVRGLPGGHSGMNIHENRGNAIKLLHRLLSALVAEVPDVGLADLRGGSMHNAIPREARAVLTLPPAGDAVLAACIERLRTAFRSELQGHDSGLEVSRGDEAPPADVLPGDARDRLLDLLSILPHGVLAMSPAIEGLVETSNNLASVRRDGSTMRIVTSGRSSIDSALEALNGSVAAAARLAGARAELHDGYPGWQPDLESPVLGTMRSVYREIWGGEPEVTAIHAGLECGLLGRRIPGLDMISFGPRIVGAHSPDERVHVESVGRFWRALRAGLAALSSSARA